MLLTGWVNYILVGLAAMAAGVVNALAGGGTLIAFPVVLATGVSAIAANVTTTVSLVPGYLGGTLAQFNDLKEQRQRFWYYLPAGILGGAAGGFLLLNTGEKLFREIVPYLILLACFLLAINDPVRKWLISRAGKVGVGTSLVIAGILPVFVAAIYGGYFGAGVSVIILAVLGLIFSDSLTKLNALKQSISFATNLAAAIYFIFSGQVVWSMAALMAVCALLGGMLGGRLAGRIKPITLRVIVIVIGVVVAMIYLIRQ